jgi:hypothetical protein
MAISRLLGLIPDGHIGAKRLIICLFWAVYSHGLPSDVLPVSLLLCTYIVASVYPVNCFCIDCRILTPILRREYCRAPA